MSKKEISRRYIIFLIGLFINSFGVSFITKANLGTSPISSMPYVLSLKYVPTLGVFTIVFSCLLILLQILLLGKKFKLESLLQFPVSIVFGIFIDLCMEILGWLNPAAFATRGISLLVGCVILGFGVYTEVIADVVMLPGEAFVKAVTIRFKTEFGTTKVCFDASMTIIACILSLLFFKTLNGVGLGTVIAAILVGFIAKGFGKKLTAFTKLLLGTAPDKVQDNKETKKTEENPLVITIAREFGSGGREVGQKLANKLGIAYYDSDILELTSQEIKRSREYVESNDQKLTHSLLFDLYMQTNEYMEIQKDKQKSVFEAEAKVIKEIASKESCVIVGRLSNFILSDVPNSYHIFLHAKMDCKIEHVMNRDKLSAKEAAAKIKKVEKERKSHCLVSTGKMWGLSQYYDFSVDTGKFGLDKTVEILTDLLPQD
ncbi:MAG: cytidylate kinase family protein [Clostridiaceae bacterium]|nr:cytidylate kinase family protein [Clostridiaceae bacterium]